MKYVFTNGKILNGTKDMQVQEGQVILVGNERITEILPAEEAGKRNLKASGYEEIDLQGKYILPGLINMHVHLAGNGKPQKKQRDNEALVKKIMSNGLTKAIAYHMVCGFAKDELYSGVTTIRTVGGLGDFDTRLRDDIAAGKKPGPRILAANEGISVPGGHMAGSVAIAAGSIEEALQHLEIAKAQKVDLVKLMITGGVLDAKEKGVPGELKMAPEMVKAVCDKAHAMGYKVAAHVESPKGVKVALQNGVDSIEHGAKADEEMIALFKEHNAFLCTTLSPALPYALFDRSITNASEVEQFNGNVVFEGIIDCAKAAIANDIPVVLGNDVGCPWITQYDFWRELYYFHKYVGVSNTFALYTATCRGAEMAGIGDITGTLEPGKCADMIVVEKNPLEDIRALRNVDMVVSQGKVLRSPKVKKKQIVETELDKFL
ncbi:MAG: amidohydrolase family protein [Waltera sp.]|mgnify:FL=1|jgi:imidazolonepropionase-like amidohydrolase|uniref:amidohydrolase family protein n=1 Tax=Waltera intestinalis TaxID=2606635 RepID=UPI000335168B|nr:imidazolonepropionase and related amidohydrolases [Firmicutes bacterium CAG:65]SCH02167.1 Cytosine deaminase and related metal-dependent hydrolases [uncultured Clostridium sp.]